jgi:uncharacterized protein (DUF1697 family)
MAVFVLLLRAIGPATHVKMSMAALREGCEKAGFTDVSTVGNTGNIILRSDKSAAETRKIVQKVVTGFGLGPSVEVFARTPRQMQMVVRANPFPEAAADHPAYVGVCSFHKTPDWGQLKSQERSMPYVTSGAHLIRDAGDGTGIGQFNVEKIVGARMTERNWRVFANLAKKAAELAKT